MDVDAAVPTLHAFGFFGVAIPPPIIAQDDINRRPERTRTVHVIRNLVKASIKEFIQLRKMTMFAAIVGRINPRLPS